MQRASRVELIVAAAAVLISVASFFLAWDQTRAMDAQVKAMTWPYLQMESGNFNEDTNAAEVTLSVRNTGVGPTRVAWFTLTLEGQPIADFGALAVRCCLDAGEDPNGLSKLPGVTSDPSPTLIPAGEERLVFRMPLDGTPEAFWKRLDAARWKLRAEACYCSILDECWVTDFDTGSRSVAQCPAAPGPDWRG
jgi:hypothetical protein